MSKSIKDILPFILDHNANWRIRLLRDWDSIWGNLSNKVHLEKIDTHQLTIGVHDSCWLQELHMLSHLLIHTINKLIGSPQIKRLYFKKIEVKQKKQASYTAPPPTVTHAQVTLTDKEVCALKTIKDPQLSSALKQFLIRCRQEK